MNLRSTFWRAALKWPRLQRLELLDLPELDARYLNIPKTGSGSIRMQAFRQLQAASDDDLPKSVLWKHTIWIRPERFPTLETRFTFAFARDPYERIASLYRHKIVGAERRGERVSRLFAVYGRRIRIGMPFDEFVHAVAAIPDDRAEKHFRSQTAFLYHGDRLLPDFVGRMEKFDEGWATVCSRSRFRPMQRAYNQTPPHPVAWSDDLRSLVAERYRRDFTLLGYET